ncbi:hypothetical protein KSS87_022806 [Heliosperma pusillum]|nr:hypothetical protein KSS87_022806 [Heliosperma pusillum]
MILGDGGSADGIDLLGSVLSRGDSVPFVRAKAGYCISVGIMFQEGVLLTWLGIPVIYGIKAFHGHTDVFNVNLLSKDIGL